MSYKRIPVPVGTILAWSGGYFGNGSNGSFTSVLGNTVAAANTVLNNSGYYVCDGSVLNDSNSPIFNGANRFLPNLTDNRFLQGSTTAGLVGGATSVTPSFTSSTIGTSGGAASFNKTVMSADQVAHIHGAGTYYALIDPFQLTANDSFAKLLGGVSWSSDVKQVYSDITNTPSPQTRGNGTDVEGSSASATVSWNSSVVNTTFTNPSFNATSLNSSFISLENRPQYLSVFYVMRIK